MHTQDFSDAASRYRRRSYLAHLSDVGNARSRTARRLALWQRPLFGKIRNTPWSFVAAEVVGPCRCRCFSGADSVRFITAFSKWNTLRIQKCWSSMLLLLLTISQRLVPELASYTKHGNRFRSLEKEVLLMIRRTVERVWSTSLAVLVVCATLLQPGAISAAPVAVRHAEGLVHGFLVLRTLAGDTLADGDLIQVASGDRVTSRLVFRFKDGSVHDETAVYSQRRNFRLLTDHLVQKGPAFQHPMEVSIDGFTRQVAVRSTDDDGKEKVVTERLDLPPDVANGLVLTLLKNVRSDAPQMTVSMVAATPKPRLVKLAITPQGEEPFSVGGSSRKATHYVVKVEIGGAAGLVAPLLGKQPPDTHVWILGGEAPAFVKSEGPLYFGGPIWRIELVSPVWPRLPTGDSKD